MNLIKRIFNKKTNLNTCVIKPKYNIHLGFTPLSFDEYKKRNLQILGIEYNVLDGLVRVRFEIGIRVESIVITSQRAVELGFINPYGLKEYADIIMKK